MFFLLLPLLATSLLMVAALPASAHAGGQLAPVVADKCSHHHLSAHPGTIINRNDVPVFSTVQGCKLIRNDTYQILTSDPCASPLPEGTVKADPEGRVNFVVMFDGCDSDTYMVTLKDTSPNHVKYHVAVELVDA